MVGAELHIEDQESVGLATIVDVGESMTLSIQFRTTWNLKIE